ncbi:MAG: hypothetical protein SWC96_14650 [Thermodesulfobacteriota bacterium]|nr:hypothetical protein [Thermodesulfobacteriota bacterium]
MTLFDDSTLDAGFRFTGLDPEALGLALSAEDCFEPVARRIGYGPDTLPSGEKAGRIKTVIAQGISAVALAGLGRPANITEWGKGGFSAGPVRVQSLRWSHVVRQAQGPQDLYGFILTLGRDFDRVKEKAALFEAYVLDGLGSEIVEQAADGVEKKLRAWCATRNMVCSRRFSPGYCDWPLAQGQQVLGDFLQPAAIDVSVLATGAMVPSKSISGAVITARSLPLSCPCPVCNQADCPWRRE